MELENEAQNHAPKTIAFRALRRDQERLYHITETEQLNTTDAIRKALKFYADHGGKAPDRITEKVRNVALTNEQIKDYKRVLQHPLAELVTKKGIEVENADRTSVVARITSLYELLDYFHKNAINY